MTDDDDDFEQRLIALKWMVDVDITGRNAFFAKKQGCFMKIIMVLFGHLSCSLLQSLQKNMSLC